MGTNRTKKVQTFPPIKKRVVEAEFSGGAVSSDGGVLLLREIDRQLGLTSEVEKRLADPRRKKSCAHDIGSLLRQRVYGLALGYEDLNDHDTLRHDPAFQTALGKDKPLASSATLCRFENRADRQLAWSIHEARLERFIQSFESPPDELILDFDATDDEVHGEQEGRFYHGYYHHYCFLPLYVFCGEQRLVSYLRPSNQDGAKHAWGILSLLVKRLRAEWPAVRIVFRADSGFCRHKMLNWCERHNVQYIIGLAKNPRLLALSDEFIELSEQRYAEAEEKQRLFGEIQYAAQSWKHQRRVIVKAECSGKGPNPRYLVTNLADSPQELYDDIYCQRSNMENRIKEQQLDLFADRTSCHRWWPNQLRVLLSSLAYDLLEGLRRVALQGTELARAQAGTIRLKLLKIGAVILRNTRRVRFLLSSHYPMQDLFFLIANRLNSG